MFFLAPGALGLAIAFLGWVGFGLVRSDLLRAVLRSSCIALFATPAIVAGHGVGVLPAFRLLLIEPLHPFAWFPIGIVWGLGLVLLLSIRSLRQSRTRWPLDVARCLLMPAHPKLLFYGVEVLLLFAAFHETIRNHWQIQTGILVAGGALAFWLCRLLADRFGQTGWLLPLAFAGPIAFPGTPVYAGLWYLAGFAGQRAGTGRPQAALWVGVGGFALLCVRSVQRTFLAIEARDLPHVTIQGGVAGAAAWAIVCFVLGAACLLAICWIRRTQEPGPAGT